MRQVPAVAHVVQTARRAALTGEQVARESPSARAHKGIAPPPSSIPDEEIALACRRLGRATQGVSQG
eukprot:1308007-Pleurochrysis_carterae.AAC.1